MLMDRIDYVLDHSAVGSRGLARRDITPAEAMRRNFWYCAIDPGSTVSCATASASTDILVESDYPHADSTWPDTQANLAAAFDGVPADEVARHVLAQRLPSCSGGSCPDGDREASCSTS